MATSTPTYAFLLPVVGADTNLWGGYLNSNFQDLEDLLDGTTPVSGIDINLGTIDATPIGNAAPSTGVFTTLSATSINSTPIGGTTPAAGAFTTLSATSMDNTPIGGTTPASGDFTTITATGSIVAGNAITSDNGTTANRISGGRAAFSTVSTAGVNLGMSVLPNYSGGLLIVHSTSGPSITPKTGVYSLSKADTAYTIGTIIANGDVASITYSADTLTLSPNTSAFKQWRCGQIVIAS